MELLSTSSAGRCERKRIGPLQDNRKDDGPEAGKRRGRHIEHKEYFMSTTNNVAASSSSGIGFTGLLTIAFIVLKLTDVIDWPWLWVLSPIWITAGLAIVVIVPLLIFLAVTDR